MGETSEPVSPARRGRQAVAASLIAAAADLLAESGPRQLSIRTVCRRAGVNPGQVYHYFGSKDALLAAGMRHLAAEHHRNAVERSGSKETPPPLSLARDQRYWRAVCHVLLDGRTDLARIEIDEDISVPRRSLAALERRHGGKLDLATRARFIAAITLELGWVAFEEFMLAILEDDAPTAHQTRREVARLAAELREEPFEDAEWDQGEGAL